MPILGIVIGQTFERLLAVARGATGEADGAFAYSHPAAVALGEHRLLRWRHPEPFPLTTRRRGGYVRRAGSHPPGDSVRRHPRRVRRRPGQRRKSTAVVFAPLITTATVSSGPGEYRPESNAASAAQPPGSATRRSRSHSSS